ncbi:MAG: rhodanese-like domain-containing protein [Gammaproteobacteria bacterium]|nr:rhodanese-like domain-containing protein [Gammaproteobacteria bacterium]
MIKTVGEIIAEAQTEINCVDVASAKALYDRSDNGVIVDLREAESAAKSKLVNSTNISRGLLEMKIVKLCPDSDTLILTHCAGGGRASLGALTLQQMGYTNVHAITATFDEIKESFG